MDTTLLLVLSIIGLYLLLTGIELFTLHSFNIRFFAFGLTIFKRNFKYRFSNWNYFNGIYSEKEARYVFIPGLRTGYFITKFDFYRNYSLIASSRGLPLTIFGRFKEVNNELFIEYRISYRLVLLFLILIGFLVIKPILTLNLIDLGIGIAILFFITVIALLIFLFQKGKMLTISDEIQKLLKIRK